MILVGAVLGGFSTGNQSLIEQVFGRFTAMPVIVYDWARKPQQAFVDLTAAAIIVLLVITLLANAIAIILRNKYERTW